MLIFVRIETHAVIFSGISVRIVDLASEAFWPKFGEICPDRDQGSPGNVMGPSNVWSCDHRLILIINWITAARVLKIIGISEYCTKIRHRTSYWVLSQLGTCENRLLHPCVLVNSNFPKTLCYTLASFLEPTSCSISEIWLTFLGYNNKIYNHGRLVY